MVVFSQAKLHGDYRIMRRILFAPPLLVLSMGFLGCSSSPSVFNGIHSTDDLIAELTSAGMTANRSGIAQRSGFQTVGENIQWENSEIEVFEYQDEQGRSLISSALSAGSEDFLFDIAGDETIWASGKIIVLYAGVDGGTILLLNGLLGDPLRYEALAIDEPFPPAVVATIRSLADQAQIDPSLIRVERYEQVDWPNACLGLPSPEEMCAQVIVPGWRVDLIAGENSYVLHTDESGEQIRYASGLD